MRNFYSTNIITEAQYQMLDSRVCDENELVTCDSKNSVCYLIEQNWKRFYFICKTMTNHIEKVYVQYLVFCR